MSYLLYFDSAMLVISNSRDLVGLFQSVVPVLGHFEQLYPSYTLFPQLNFVYFLFPFWDLGYPILYS